MRFGAAAVALVLMTSVPVSAQDAGVRLYAAGSLRLVMTDIAQAFTAAGGGPISGTFGASGLLRERIEKGEPAEVFASADLGNAEALAKAGRAAPPVVFTHNRLCALIAPGVDVTPDTLLDRMLDPHVKLGTSTPKADPSGDYTWQLFEKAEKLHPGAYAALDRKALKLTGGADSPPPPADRSNYAVLVTERKADIFLTYCTNAMQAVREAPGARIPPPAVTPAAKLVVGGNVANPLSLGVDDLARLPVQVVEDVRQIRVGGAPASGGDQVRRYRGVLLRDVLAVARPAEKERFDLRQSIVVATATDGYKAVFSWAELLLSPIGEGAFVIFERDGVPLPPNEGPLALVSLRDTQPGPRHVKWLAKIELMRVRD